MIMQLRAVHERWLVALVALHSLIVGIVFMAAPEWTIRFGGWAGIDPVFFARQAGIFHVVLAAAYMIEHRRYGGVAILITAKTIAVVFLAVMAVVEPATWAMYVSAVGDGVMGMLVWWVHRSLRDRRDSSSF